MFIAFISKYFVETFYSGHNINSTLWYKFNTFLQELNIDYLICDFDKSLIDEKIEYKLTIGALFQYKIGKTIHLNKSIEYYLTDGFNEFTTIPFYSAINPYFHERSLFFINISPHTLIDYPQIKSLKMVSSINFEATFSTFLINGDYRNQFVLSELYNTNPNCNPLNCKNCNVLLFDDQYLIKRHHSGVLNRKNFKENLEIMLKPYISNIDNKSKILLFAVPKFTRVTGNQKLPWNDEEKAFIDRTLYEITKKLCINSSFKVIYHDLDTHSRRLLTNMHLFSFSDGFDTIIKAGKKLKVRTEDLRFESVFLISSAQLLKEYIANRLLQLDTHGVFKIFKEH